jgi:molybdopterin converting factor small subunit
VLRIFKAQYNKRVSPVEVNVKLVSTFAKYRGNLANDKATVKEGSVIRDLAKKVGLPSKLVRLVFINGKQVDLGTPLSEGDTVFFLPPALGGG